MLETLETSGNVPIAPPTTTTTPIASPPALSTSFLDGLRGLAAVFVLIHHASYLLHRGYLVQWESFRHVEYPPTHAMWHRAVITFFRLFSYGNAGVIFFFVLSGFVIHLRYAKAFGRDQGAPFGWRHFVWRRLRRLYPPLLFALALTALLDVVGMRTGSPIYFSRTIYPWINGTVVVDLRPVTLLGNLLFLGDVYVPKFGGNGPLWTLTYEWWFYMLYPLLWLIWRRSSALASGFVGVAFALSFVPSIWPMELPRRVLAMLPAWWFGAMLADVYTRRLRVPFAALIPLIAGVACLPVRGLHHDVKMAALGLGSVGVIALCFHLSSRGWSLRRLSDLRFLGDMSYTLYATHVPVLVFVAATLIFTSSDAQLPYSLGPMLTGIAAALLIAWAAHFVVERPFIRRRRERAPDVSTTLSC